MEKIPVNVMYSRYYDLENWGQLKYAHADDAGFDFRATIPCIIHPKQRVGIPTGVTMMIPSGYHLEIRPRSGLAYNNGITVLNTPGTIDSGYIGEISVILINHGPDTFEINYGDRIAQGVLMQHITSEFITVTELKKTERGEGKYGSTGTN